MTDVRVMVVDDQPAFRCAAAEVVELADGFVLVGEANDGKAAMALASERDPQLVVMDVHMPGVGGVEAAAAIRARRPHVVVVLVSTYATADLPADVAASGFAYLHKERFGPEALAAAWRGRGPR